MKINKTKIGAVLLLFIFGVGFLGSDMLRSCTTPDKSKETPTENLVQSPTFLADSAYYFIEKQVKIGPRVVGTTNHKKCGDWIISELKKMGLEVKEQPFQAKFYDGSIQNARNIIASWQPTLQKRILLAAHWDTRPIADKDIQNKEKPIDGANDGASGVGILLEVARVLSRTKQQPAVGIDFIFFDAEDNGPPHTIEMKNAEKLWCLGSQYWSKNKHIPNYSAYFGILLDMVGAKNAQFPKEGLSLAYANDITNRVWKIAKQLNYGNYFVDKEAASMIDDHMFVNEIAKIPMIDIIQLDESGNFGQYHHTHQDSISIIDKNTLQAVGQTIVQILYQGW